MNGTTIVYNSQKSGYLAKCWNITMKAIKVQVYDGVNGLRLVLRPFLVLFLGGGRRVGCSIC